MIFTSAAIEHIRSIMASNPNIFVDHTASLVDGATSKQVALAAAKNEHVRQTARAKSVVMAAEIPVLNSLSPGKRASGMVVDFDGKQGLFLA